RLQHRPGHIPCRFDSDRVLDLLGEHPRGAARLGPAPFGAAEFQVTVEDRLLDATHAPALEPGDHPGPPRARDWSRPPDHLPAADDGAGRERAARCLHHLTTLSPSSTPTTFTTGSLARF